MDENVASPLSKQMYMCMHMYVCIYVYRYFFLDTNLNERTKTSLMVRGFFISYYISIFVNEERTGSQYVSILIYKYQIQKYAHESICIYI